MKSTGTGSFKSDEKEDMKKIKKTAKRKTFPQSKPQSKMQGGNKKPQNKKKLINQMIRLVGCKGPPKYQVLVPKACN